MSDQIPSQEDSTQGLGYSFTQKLCPLHQNKEYIYISTDPARTDDLVFKCEFCVVEQTLQSKYLLPISQLATSDLKTVFWHWPLPDNSELLEKVRALSTREKPDAAYKQKIDKFFKEMRIEVMARIDEVQASMNKQAQTLWDFDHAILELYSQLSAKEALKSAVRDNSERIEQLSMRIRKTVAGVLSDTEVAAASLKSSLAQLELQESAIDFADPQRLKEDILASISRISMFLVENMQDLQMQEQQEQPAHLGQMEAEAEGNLDVILRLASCRFNDLSEGFRERMKSQLQKFRRIFDTVQLGEAKEQECKRVAEFDSLEEEEMREVKAFAERLIEAKKRRQRGEKGNMMKIEDLVRLLSNKANHVSEEMIAKTRAMLEGVSRYFSTFEVESIHKEGFELEEFAGMSDSEISTAVNAIAELKGLFGKGEEKQALSEAVYVGKQIARAMAQPRQENLRSLNIEKIMELVKNDTNFCSEEYVHSLQTALKGVQRYLESFQLAERENDGLDKEQLSSLGKLGSKIKDLSARFGANYKGRSSPNEEEQPKSVRVSRWLVNHIGSNGQKELDSLLSKLPVFELTQCEWVGHTPIQWKWMKTGYRQSSTLQLQNEGNGVRIVQTNQCVSQAVTENHLASNLVYSVKCTFNKPLNGVQHVMVGLISEDQINSCHLGYDDSRNSFWSDPPRGPTQIIKGQFLNSAALNTTVTTILFRFCIQTQSFFVSDPTLQNISQVEKTKINPNSKYRFGICFYNFGNDYSCLFSDIMTSIDQAIVDKF